MPSNFLKAVFLKKYVKNQHLANGRSSIYPTVAKCIKQTLQDQNQIRIRTAKF